MRRLLRVGGFLLVTVGLASACGGKTASFPDTSDAGNDASASSSGSSGGIASSSSGGSGAGSSSGSSGGGSGSGSGNSSGSASGSGSGSSSSSGGTCTPCTSDQQCQAACPPVAGGTNCCDLNAGGVCYATTNSTCPVPSDACPTSGAICPPNDAGVIPPNPNTGSVGCDDCIECSCGSQWCACVGDSGVDGSGNPTGCAGYVNCVIACVADAGVQVCAQNCSAGHSAQQVAEGNAFLQCVVGSCNTPSTCGM